MLVRSGFYLLLLVFCLIFIVPCLIFFVFSVCFYWVLSAFLRLSSAFIRSLSYFLPPLSAFIGFISVFIRFSVCFHWRLSYFLRFLSVFIGLLSYFIRSLSAFISFTSAFISFYLVFVGLCPISIVFIIRSPGHVTTFLSFHGFGLPDMSRHVPTLDGICRCSVSRTCLDMSLHLTVSAVVHYVVCLGHAAACPCINRPPICRRHTYCCLRNGCILQWNLLW